MRLFLAETTIANPEAYVGRSDLFAAFEEWARQNRRQTLGRHRFFEHVDTAGYRVATRRGLRGFVGLELLAEAEWGGPDPGKDGAGVQKVQFSHTPASRGDDEGESKKVS